MKKYIYLCGMMLLSANMTVQIDLNDRNWNAVLIEDFDEPASYWQWGQNSFINPNRTWRAYSGSGVTLGTERQVYQYSQCQIDVANQHMKLVAEYDSQGRIQNLNVTSYEENSNHYGNTSLFRNCIRPREPHHPYGL